MNDNNNKLIELLKQKSIAASLFEQIEKIFSTFNPLEKIDFFKKVDTAPVPNMGEEIVLPPIINRFFGIKETGLGKGEVALTLYLKGATQRGSAETYDMFINNRPFEVKTLSDGEFRTGVLGQFVDSNLYKRLNELQTGLKKIVAAYKNQVPFEISEAVIFFIVGLADLNKISSSKFIRIKENLEALSSYAKQLHEISIAKMDKLISQMIAYHRGKSIPMSAEDPESVQRYFLQFPYIRDPNIFDEDVNKLPIQTFGHVDGIFICTSGGKKVILINPTMIKPHRITQGGVNFVLQPKYFIRDWVWKAFTGPRKDRPAEYRPSMEVVTGKNPIAKRPKKPKVKTNPIHVHQESEEEDIEEDKLISPKGAAKRGLIKVKKRKPREKKEDTLFDKAVMNYFEPGLYYEIKEIVKEYFATRQFLPKYEIDKFIKDVESTYNTQDLSKIKKLNYQLAKWWENDKIEDSLHSRLSYLVAECEDAIGSNVSTKVGQKRITTFKDSLKRIKKEFLIKEDTFPSPLSYSMRASEPSKPMGLGYDVGNAPGYASAPIQDRGKKEIEDIRTKQWKKFFKRWKKHLGKNLVKRLKKFELEEDLFHKAGGYIAHNTMNRPAGSGNRPGKFPGSASAPIKPWEDEKEIEDIEEKQWKEFLRKYGQKSNSNYYSGPGQTTGLKGRFSKRI